MRGWLVVLVVACGDNRLVPDAAIPLDAAIDARPADAPPAGVDLAMIPDQMTPSIQLVEEAFNPTSCAVVEQCVGGPGLRKLLKFDTVTANIGLTDLVVGVPPAPGVDEEPFTWSPCHLHHHLAGYAIYELLDGNGVVLSGHKQAFCLQDIQQVRAGAPSNGFHCNNQGLTAGWADVYSRTLACQWIDVTGLAPGTYTLRIRINPDGTLPDADPSNNEYLQQVVI
jgi:hypothetical protein